MKIKKLIWSEPEKSPHYKYDCYIKAETPLGDVVVVYSDNLYGIETMFHWKAGRFEEGLTVDSLKEIAEQMYQDRVLSCFE